MSILDPENAVEAARQLPETGAERLNAVIGWFDKNSTDIGLAAVAALVIALILLGLRTFGHRLIRDGGHGWRHVFGRVLARTGSLFIMILALKLVAGQVDTPEPLQRVIDIAFVVISAIQAAVWARELVLGLIEHRIGDDADNRTLGSAMGIIRLLVTIALFAIAIVLILDNLGVNVTGLVAGLGIGGIAIGLAAQGIFSDLFAALSILFDRPFRRGDTISFGGITGTVERIGLKSTRVRALSGEQVIVSNAKLLDQQLQNFALLVRRRAVMAFGLIYQTAPDLVAQVPGELRTIIEGVDNATYDRCHASGFGASSIDFELVFYAETADYAAFMQVRQDIMVAMMRRFAALGLDFAYPTQTTFTAAPDGKMIMPYAPVRTAAESEPAR